MPNRAKAEAFILKYLDKILPGSPNTEIYKSRFKKMSDAEFDVFMKDLESGKVYLTVTCPNFAKPDLNVERNLKVADELNYSFFHRLWIGAKDGNPAFLTPVKHMVIDLPLRRASQTLKKKIRMPENNKTVDVLSGQPTGASKGAKISYPELQVLAAMGLDNTIVELIKFRGGDKRGFDAMNTMINRTGAATISTLENYSSGVESVRTMKTFLTAMMITSTL